MQLIFLDYETYWSATHSLTKMSPLTYVMHPDTEIQSVSLKVGANGKTKVIFGEEAIRAEYAKIDWSDAMVIAHNNSEFDALIHSWRFGINPKMWGCTMAMARPTYAKTVGISLRALMEVTNCPYQKGSLEEVNTKGKKLAEFTKHEKEKMTEYNRIDTDGCAWVFSKLAKGFSTNELIAIDITIRMLVDPKIEADVPLLETALATEKLRKETALLDVATVIGVYEPGMDEEVARESCKKMLASSAKFATFLKDLGVEPPMKPSPSNPAKQIPALSKTDQDFLALMEHSDPLVRAAAESRLDVKSTILESRIEKFIEAASAAGGMLPMPLKYCGADTTGRWSGFLFNPQNLPRINPKEPKPTDVLRNSLRAPKGTKIVVADLSGIELRVNMFLWRVPYAMELFTSDPEKADLYRYFAANELFHKPESEVTKMDRQVGKVSHLGLGYGAGAGTFVKVAKLMGGIDMSEDESKKTVSAYRSAHPEVVNGWKSCQQALQAIYEGTVMDIDPLGLCKTFAGGIKTPVGVIRYPNLRQEEKLNDDGTPTGKMDWVYGEGRHKAKIYGAKCVENLVQHLARGVILDNMLTIRKQYNVNPVLTVHDELVYIAEASIAEDLLEKVQETMRTPPTWWPELAVWSEGGVGDTYGEVK